MTAKLTGAIFTYATHALYVGPLIASARHRHHAGQIVWAPDGVDVTNGDEPPRRAITHILSPHQWHSHGGSRMAAVLWLDRDDACWEPTSRTQERPSEDARIEGALSPEAARALADAMIAWVAPRQASLTPRHIAVERMRRWLDAHTGNEELRVTDLARQSGLSVRQLRHRFTEEVGVNPSGYLRWRRLRHAIVAIEHGASLTQGAVDAGFADGAHFSRVFRAQFGVAPSLALSSLLARTGRR